jgi:hypothetical protein
VKPLESVTNDLCGGAALSPFLYALSVRIHLGRFTRRFTSGYFLVAASRLKKYIFEYLVDFSKLSIN